MNLSAALTVAGLLFLVVGAVLYILERRRLSTADDATVDLPAVSLARSASDDATEDDLMAMGDAIRAAERNAARHPGHVPPPLPRPRMLRGAPPVERRPGIAALRLPTPPRGLPVVRALPLLWASSALDLGSVT